MKLYILLFCNKHYQNTKCVQIKKSEYDLNVILGHLYVISIFWYWVYWVGISSAKKVSPQILRIVVLILAVWVHNPKLNILLVITIILH